MSRESKERASERLAAKKRTLALKAERRSTAYFGDDTATMLAKAKAFGENGPKRHHLVPAFYLRNWASGRALRMTDLDAHQSVLVPPEKAAKRTQFYSLKSEDVDPETTPPLLVEYLLSQLEGQSAPLLDQLATDPTSITEDDAFVIATFLGFQLVRGMRTRNGIRETVARIFQETLPHNASDEQLAAMLTADGHGAGPDDVARLREAFRRFEDGEVRAAPQQAALVGYAVEHAATVGFHFFKRCWTVCETPPLLITTDEPVVPVSGPGGDRQAMGGPAIAGVVLFPLRADRLLVMARTDLALVHTASDHFASIGAPLDHNELAEVNRELAAHAFRYTFETPSRNQGSTLDVPPSAGVVGHEEMTGRVIGEGADDDQVQQVLRSFTPNRWANAHDLPDWPVRRWWPEGTLTPMEYGSANREEIEIDFGPPRRARRDRDR